MPASDGPADRLEAALLDLLDRRAAGATVCPSEVARQVSGSPDGLPFSGSRAWRCRIAAPASAASIAWWAMSSGVTGRCGDIDGVWIEPVMAQVMMVLFFLRKRASLGRWVLRQG